MRPSAIDDGVSTILTEPGLRAAVERLAADDREIAATLDRIGYPGPRVREPGFPTLLRIIIAQQVSTASAAALWGKLERTLGGDVEPARFLRLDDASLRACGFSAGKMRYGRALAEAVRTGALPIAALGSMEEAAAVAALTRLPGFGRWSAEVYLLFALGRPDVFPADDLALQIAYQRLKALPARPTAKALRAMVAHWAPCRGAGAVFLWHVYGAATLDPKPSPAPVR